MMGRVEAECGVRHVGEGDSRMQMFFFFSSRRRHTRLQGDWSSDVCSSDLAPRQAHVAGGARPSHGSRTNRSGGIGRASGRGRGEISVGAGSLKKKKRKKCTWQREPGRGIKTERNRATGDTRTAT